MSRHRRQQHKRARRGAFRRRLVPVCRFLVGCKLPRGARLVSLTVDRVSRAVAYCTASVRVAGWVDSVDTTVRVTL